MSHLLHESNFRKLCLLTCSEFSWIFPADVTYWFTMNLNGSSLMFTHEWIQLNTIGCRLRLTHLIHLLCILSLFFWCMVYLRGHFWDQFYSLNVLFSQWLSCYKYAHVFPWVWLQEKPEHLWLFSLCWAASAQHETKPAICWWSDATHQTAQDVVWCRFFFLFLTSLFSPYTYFTHQIRCRGLCLCFKTYFFNQTEACWLFEHFCADSLNWSALRLHALLPHFIQEP